MITTVTLNPMLDKTVYVDRIRRGETSRASKIETVVGGKGINVARQLKHLEIKTLATGFAGGETGDLIDRLLNEEHILHEFVRVGGMTREGVTYRELDGTVTAVFEPAHQITSEEAQKLVECVAEKIPQSTWVVCSGSSPSEAADEVFAGIIQLATKQSVKSVLDSYGKVCWKAIESMPTILKINKDEYEKTFGKTLLSEKDYHIAFDELTRLGIHCSIITDGDRPVYATANDSHRLKIIPPTIKAVNSTGCGDSMVAACLYALSSGWEIERALAFGVAAGAANAGRWGIANSPLSDIVLLEQAVSIERMN
ncbi:MAG: hexose kinase [bacterium]